MSTLVTTINTIGLKLPQEKQAEIKENLANLFASVEKAKKDAENVVVEDHSMIDKMITWVKSKM